MAPGPGLCSLDTLADWTMEEWLRAACVLLATSDHLVDRAAALGLIGRCWHPVDASERTAWRTYGFGFLLLEHPNLALRVLEAVKAVPVDRLRLLEQLAANDAVGLLGLLREIETSDEPSRSALVRRLVERRDNLESVFFVLVQRDLGRELGAALADVDDEVTSAWSALPEAGAFADDPRLAIVAVREPDAWWGHLGEIQ